MTIRFFGRHSPGASLLILLVATVASAADVRLPASQNWDSIVKEPRRKGRSLSIRIYLFSGVLVFSLCPIKSGCCTNEHKDPVMIDAALVIPVYRSRDGELRDRDDFKAAGRCAWRTGGVSGREARPGR